MTNPFFAQSTLPYQLPPFADIAEEHYLPAFEKGFEEQLAEVSNITRRRDMPSFENTMIPLEQSGQTLLRVARVFYNKSSADSNDFTTISRRRSPRSWRPTRTPSSSTRSSTGASRRSTTSSTRWASRRNSAISWSATTPR